MDKNLFGFFRRNYYGDAQDQDGRVWTRTYLDICEKNRI